METNTPPDPRLMPDDKCLVVSVPEAAELLGISRALAYVLAGRGELPTLRLGHRVVIPRAALLALVDTATTTE
jgi:excisionase family DNA binding protein